LPADTSFVVAAFVVNELQEADREELLRQIRDPRDPRDPRLKPGAIGSIGARPSLLIVEPISNRISPWWPEWVAALGGRADEWKVRVDVPPLVKRLAKAAGLRPEVLTARSLWVSGH
jgi:hypothetical protein